MTERGWRRWLGLAIFVGVVVGGSWLVGPRSTPHLRHSAVLNAVFDTRWMVGLVRLLVIAASAYAIQSMAVRVTRGHWLTQAGPMKAGIDPVEDVLEDRDRLRDELATAVETIDELRATIEDPNESPLASDATMADTGHSEDVESGAEVDAGDDARDGINRSDVLEEGSIRRRQAVGTHPQDPR